jgi:GH25 family lysozyme M1 (1,4-beta-N-acetylmuramidase)|nr:MAG TPA: hypothetical protein [Caudoviricetes sp.]
MTKLNGIDVSHYQGNINWKAVKEYGIEFAFIKCLQGKSKVDEYFHINMRNAIANDIPVGVYVYSKAKTIDDAVAEAKRVIKECSQYKLTYPVVFDFESKHFEDMSLAMRGKIIDAFCQTILSDGKYIPMLYSSRYWLMHMIPAEVVKKYDIWLAEYTTGKPKYTGDYKIWQYGVGKVTGIIGDVDMNIGYYDYGKENNMEPIIFGKEGIISCEDVKKLQKFLNEMHYHDMNGNNLVEDGKYGRKTDYALNMFVNNHANFANIVPAKVETKLTINGANLIGTLYKTK